MAAVCDSEMSIARQNQHGNKIGHSYIILYMVKVDFLFYLVKKLLKRSSLFGNVFYCHIILISSFWNVKNQKQKFTRYSKILKSPH